MESFSHGSGGPRSAADFTIELDRLGRVGQLVTDLGEFWTDFPIRVRLDVSPDGSRWDTVYLGDTALHAYYGALRHPRQAPIVFTVNRDNVRFIRLTQLGWGAHDWSSRGVRVASVTARANRSACSPMSRPPSRTLAAAITLGASARPWAIRC